jgi:hypothetical protein
MQINETGENLDILIYAELSQDWETFGTWYSITKSLPDAKIAVAINRSKDVPFQSFQWAKRLSVPHWYRNANPSCDDRLEAALQARKSKRLISERMLVVDALTMFVDVLTSQQRSILNAVTKVWTEIGLRIVGPLSDDGLADAIFEKSLDDPVEEVHGICQNVKNAEGYHSIVNYSKGCGKWIDKMKGCPFASASGMVANEMTLSETRVIDLWRKMSPIYGAVR